MTENLKLTLEKTYAIKILSSNPVEGGVLSTNESLTSDAGELFLKQYRPEITDRIPDVHKVKKFFSDHGIPAILPIPTIEGTTVLQIDDQIYALFPFIHGRLLKRGELSNTALRSAGGMLAKIHILSKDTVPVLIEKRGFGPDQNKFYDQAKQIIRAIKTQAQTTAFDEQVLELIQLKLQIADEIKEKYPTPDWGKDHLIHGDFHEGNLFFDNDDQITHVFDWEKTNIVPRTREFGRSLMYLCFALKVSSTTNDMLARRASLMHITLFTH